MSLASSHRVSGAELGIDPQGKTHEQLVVELVATLEPTPGLFAWAHQESCDMHPCRCVPTLVTWQSTLPQ